MLKKPCQSSLPTPRTHPYENQHKRTTKKNHKYGESCIAIGARFLPLAFETFGRTSDEVVKLLRNLVGRGSEAKQVPFSRLLSHWKRRLATTLQSPLFILNTSANILYASNRYTPNQDTCIENLDDITYLQHKLEQSTFSNILSPLGIPF